MRPSSRNCRAKTRQVSKLAEIRQALVVAGCDTAAKQGAVLGVSRSTAWALLHRDKRTGPTAILVRRILSSPNLQPAARRKFEEYIERKIRGGYGRSERRTREFRDWFRILIAASTTSIQDSGLFQHLLPIFVQKTGIAVKVVAAGTGRALDAGRRGEADIVFTHAKSTELRFLAEREGVKRFPLMYNDFVLVGPTSDPAGIKGMKNVAKAFRAMKNKRVTFISRGDRSGTHLAELIFWNMDPATDIEKEKGPWYKSISKGMGEALNTASASHGYVLTDRGTWISFKNKGDLQILVEGDKRMFNQYAVMLVNSEKHPDVKREFGQAFIDWLVSEEGQEAIANYKINGEQLFFPNATDPKA